jgi:uncharacterized sulfatase
MTRRGFVAAMGAAGLVGGAAAQQAKPNILWITCEDIGSQIGAYGDKYADTPTLDRLAARGMIYRNAWSNAPVCAPARTQIISGMYANSTGSEHMRSMTRLPEGMRMYPCYLRDAGYYATNNSKEDYNLEHTGKVWDESSAKAHWRNRQPGQPFFSIFNFVTTHESQVRRRPHTWIHDPAKVRVPAYHPDTIEVRQDWAEYYDNITTMDKQAAEVLKQLEEDGLAESTVVFFYGDHGAGMPRSKRWPYNTGLHVPLIMHIPEKFRHLAPQEYKPGGASERMVAFVDLGPTVISLAGVKPPAHMQGSAFAGANPGPERQYNYGLRGRMDERYDCVRSVRDHRYVYIRNYMPHLIYGQHISYMFETPTTQVWKRLYDEGKLKPPQTYFWEPKPPEELYDLQNDPDEVNNLAQSPEYREVLERMRKAEHDWVSSVRDVGLLPEAEIHSRSKDSTPYEMGHDPRRYPFQRVLATAAMASWVDLSRAAQLVAFIDTPQLVRRLADEDSGVRYWAAMGLLMRGAQGVRGAAAPLRKALGDAAPSVRVVAAEALGRFGGAEDLDQAVKTLIELAPPDKNGVYVAMAALNAIDRLGEKGKPARQALKGMSATDPAAPKRTAEYVPRLLKDLAGEK